MKRRNRRIMHNPALSKYFWLCLTGLLVVLLLNYNEQM